MITTPPRKRAAAPPPRRQGNAPPFHLPGANPRPAIARRGLAACLTRHERGAGIGCHRHRYSACSRQVQYGRATARQQHLRVLR
eukprot:1675058-Pleurochrysis_carterae.AAC.1